MTVIHLKKKDVVKSKVRGVEVEFDHEKLATILGIPGNNGICEYIKEVWEESKYTKPLEITRRFANDENIMAARRVNGGRRADDETPRQHQQFQLHLQLSSKIKNLQESTPRVQLAEKLNF
ncbi:hypothetical protein Dimus_022236 [Dionaea muscipula]